jgi:hypothetical protein
MLSVFTLDIDLQDDHFSTMIISRMSKWSAYLAQSMALLLLGSAPVFAVQTHGEPEGLVAHQFAHLFFVVSMGTLAFWLHRWKLTAAAGWRYIQFGAILLIVWNIGAMAAHFLDEPIRVLTVTQIDLTHLRIDTPPGFGPLGSWYYVLKLDHLLCVPALALLYMGLRHLVGEAENKRHREKRP